MNMRSAILAVALLAAVPAALAARAGPLDTGRTLLQAGQLACSPSNDFFKPTGSNLLSKCCKAGKPAGSKSTATYTTPFCPNSACPGSDLGENLDNCGQGTLMKQGSCPTEGWTCNITKATTGTTCTPGKDVHCLGTVSCNRCPLEGSLCLIDGTSKSARRCSGAPKPTIALAAVIPSGLPNTPVTITSTVNKDPSVKATCTVSVFSSCDTPTTASTKVGEWSFQAGYDSSVVTDAQVKGADDTAFTAAGKYLVTLSCDYTVKQASGVEVPAGTLLASATYARASTPSVTIAASPATGDVNTATTVTVSYSDKDSCTRLECTATVTVNGGENLVPGWTFTIAASDASGNTAVSTVTSSTYAALLSTVGNYTATVTCSAYRGASNTAFSTPSDDDTYERTEIIVKIGPPPFAISSAYCNGDATDASALSDMRSSSNAGGDDYLYEPRVAVFSGDAIQYACDVATTSDDWAISTRSIHFTGHTDFEPASDPTNVLSASVTVPTLADGTDVSDVDGVCTLTLAPQVDCTDTATVDCSPTPTVDVLLKVFRSPTLSDPTWTGASVYTGAATTPTCTATAYNTDVITTPSGQFDATVTNADGDTVTDLTAIGTYTASCSITYDFDDTVAGADYVRSCSPHTVSSSDRTLTVVPVPELAVQFYDDKGKEVSSTDEGTTGVVACVHVTQDLQHYVADLELTIGVTPATGSTVTAATTTVNTDAAFSSSVPSGEDRCVLGSDDATWVDCWLCAPVPDTYLADQSDLTTSATGTTSTSDATDLTSNTDELAVNDVCAKNIRITHVDGTDALTTEHSAWTTTTLNVAVSFTDVGAYDTHIVTASLLRHQTGGSPWVAVDGSEKTVTLVGSGTAAQSTSFAWAGLDGKYKIDVSITDPARGTACKCSDSSDNGKCRGAARRNSRNKWHVTAYQGDVPAAAFPVNTPFTDASNGLCKQLSLVVPTVGTNIKVKCATGNYAAAVNNFEFVTKEDLEWDIVWIGTTGSEGKYRVTGWGDGYVQKNGGDQVAVKFAIHAIDNRDRLDRFFIAVWPAAQGSNPTTYYIKTSILVDSTPQTVTANNGNVVNVQSISWGSSFEYNVAAIINNDVAQLASYDGLIPRIMDTIKVNGNDYYTDLNGADAGVFVGNNGGQGPAKIGF